MIPILPDTSSPDTSRIPAALVESCVKCGLCLPHCPTYTLTHDEAESPRGRIGLMQAMAASDERPGRRLVNHLEQCLACRRCEAVCPAEVPYGRLIDAARAELWQRGHRPPAAERVLLAVAASTGLRRIVTRALRAVLALRLPRLIRAVAPQALRRLLDRLPVRPPASGLPELTAARNPRLGRVTLFSGCMGNLLDAQVLQDHIHVLSTAGFDVQVPPEQVCCGALALHAGDVDTAGALMRRNAAVFAADRDEPIVLTATGCGATLREYDQLIGAERFATRVHDAAWVLAHAGWQPPGDGQQRLIAVHEPCTQRNVIREHDATLALLEKIPGSKVVELPGNDSCCGAAGAQVLTNADYARRLLAPKLAAVGELRPDVVVTANLGCAMHLRGGLRRAGLPVGVMHPISLISDLLKMQR